MELSDISLLTHSTIWVHPRFKNSYGGQLHIQYVISWDDVAPEVALLLQLVLYSLQYFQALWSENRASDVSPTRSNLIYICAYHTQDCAYYKSRTHTALYRMCSDSHTGWRSGHSSVLCFCFAFFSYSMCLMWNLLPMPLILFINVCMIPPACLSLF